MEALITNYNDNNLVASFIKCLGPSRVLALLVALLPVQPLRETSYCKFVFPISVKTQLKLKTKLGSNFLGVQFFFGQI